MELVAKPLPTGGYRLDSGSVVCLPPASMLLRLRPLQGLTSVPSLTFLMPQLERPLSSYTLTCISIKRQAPLKPLQDLLCFLFRLLQLLDSQDGA